MIGLVMMLGRSVALLGVLLMGFIAPCTTALYAGNGLGVQLNGDCLSGTVTQVPLGRLMLELLERDGSRWNATEDLGQPISVSLDGLTIEQGVQKVMRLSGLNYALIWQHQPEAPSRKDRIKKVAVYDQGAVVWFTAANQGTDPPFGTPIRSPEIPVETSVTHAVGPSERTIEALPVSAAGYRADAAVDGAALTGFVNQLAQEKQISREEYGMILEKLGKPTQ